MQSHSKSTRPDPRSRSQSKSSLKEQAHTENTSNPASVDRNTNDNRRSNGNGCVDSHEDESEIGVMAGEATIATSAGGDFLKAGLAGEVMQHMCLGGGANTMFRGKGAVVAKSKIRERKQKQQHVVRYFEGFYDLSFSI